MALAAPPFTLGAIPAVVIMEAFSLLSGLCPLVM